MIGRKSMLDDVLCDLDSKGRKKYYHIAASVGHGNFGAVYTLVSAPHLCSMSFEKNAEIKSVPSGKYLHPLHKYAMKKATVTWLEAKQKYERVTLEEAHAEYNVLPTIDPSEQATVWGYESPWETHVDRVPYVGSYVTERTTVVSSVMTLHEGFVRCDEYLSRNKERSLWQRVALYEAVVLELSKIHNKKYIHMDLHTGNVLIHPVTKQVKIIDFGVTVAQGESPLGFFDWIGGSDEEQHNASDLHIKSQRSSESESSYETRVSSITSKVKASLHHDIYKLGRCHKKIILMPEFSAIVEKLKQPKEEYSLVSSVSDTWLAYYKLEHSQQEANKSISNAIKQLAQLGVPLSPCYLILIRDDSVILRQLINTVCLRKTPDFLKKNTIEKILKSDAGLVMHSADDYLEISQSIIDAYESARSVDSDAANALQKCIGLLFEDEFSLEQFEFLQLDLLAEQPSDSAVCVSTLVDAGVMPAKYYVEICKAENQFLRDLIMKRCKAGDKPEQLKDMLDALVRNLDAIHQSAISQEKIGLFISQLCEHDVAMVPWLRWQVVERCPKLFGLLVDLSDMVYGAQAEVQTALVNKLFSSNDIEEVEKELDVDAFDARLKKVKGLLGCALYSDEQIEKVVGLVLQGLSLTQLDKLLGVGADERDTISFTNALFLIKHQIPLGEHFDALLDRQHPLGSLVQFTMDGFFLRQEADYCQDYIKKMLYVCNNNSFCKDMLGSQMKRWHVQPLLFDLDRAIRRLVDLCKNYMLDLSFDKPDDPRLKVTLHVMELAHCVPLLDKVGEMFNILKNNSDGYQRLWAKIEASPESLPIALCLNEAMRAVKSNATAGPAKRGLFGSLGRGVVVPVGYNRDQSFLSCAKRAFRCGYEG
jgi:serine/threonine protein kinase